MEHSTLVHNTPVDDLATKNRFESFKFGKGLPSHLSGPKQRHVRSHSRNHSVSSSISISSTSTTSARLPLPANNDLSAFSFPCNEPLATSTSPPTLNPAPKRNSHHRRKSSVSTRRESAELMGISLPDLPQCSSENNINFGEKDSIRRRALMALEGKPDLSTPKVEIPELSTPNMEKIMFELSTSKSHPTGLSANFGSSLGSSLGAKRDSFKLLASSSASKDQLHTLVEEEEEEEEEEQYQDSEAIAQDSLPSRAVSVTEPASVEEPPVPVAPVLAVTKPTPTRPRPATLNLKPLSLTPESLVSSAQALPTPLPTPSPRAGLRSLTLGSLGGDESVGTSSAASSRRNSTSPIPSNRRPSLNLDFGRCESPVEDLPTRRSSISYKRSHNTATSLAGLPTPEMTPTFAKDRRFSSGSDSIASPIDDGFFPSPPAGQFTRPLSASEQHFLFKSHNALLARITDLERALSVQRRQSSGGVSFTIASRRESVTSNSTESTDLGSAGPDDEMLRLIADLKAERDELKRDVDGWRNRVGDVEKQLSIVTKRIETERRDAWVARSRVGLLDAEKSVLEKRLEGVERMIQDLEAEKRTLESESRVLRTANEKKDTEIEELQKALALTQEELYHERELRKQAEIEAASAIMRSNVHPTRKKVSTVTSIDSSSSVTDVEIESTDISFSKFGFSLKAVQEEDDDDASGEDGDNGLAGYEDEDDEDDAFDSSSSFDSMDRFPRFTRHLQADIPVTPPSQTSGSTTPALVSRSVSPDTSVDTSFSSPLPDLPARPSHVSRASLSRAWTFPKSIQSHVSEHSVDNDVDKFFGCLEDSDGNGGESDFSPISPSTFSYEKSKNLFASGFKYGDDEEDTPFFLPDNVGTVVEEKVEKRLSIVNEEEEEVEEELRLEGESEMFGEASGITITFTPAEDEDEELSQSQLAITSPVKADRPPILPDLNFDDSDSDDECAIPFNFGRSMKSASSCSASCSSDYSDTSAGSSSSPSPPWASVLPSVSVSPPSIPRPASPRTASSIPRAIVFRPSTTDVFTSSPPRNSPPSLPRVSSAHPVSPNTYVTPPTKRGGTSPSFIPQPISSPSPVRVASVIPKSKPIPTSTFVRQPQRKSLVGSGNIKNPNGVGISVANVNSTMNARSLHRSCDRSTTTQKQTSEMKSIDLSHSDPFSVRASQDECGRLPSTSGGNSSFSIFSSPVSSRLSLQTLTNFIPLSWNPMASAAVNHVAPSTSGNWMDVEDGPTPVSSKETSARINERRYVSREGQLERLRKRLETEGKTIVHASVNFQCRKCVGHGFVEL